MSKKIKKYKVGIDSETYAISMVESPAIESDFVALSKDEEKTQVLLDSDERHMVYGAALIPDKDIYRNNGEQEFYISFTRESIEKMSQDFMKEYRQHEVTLDHETQANEVCVVESWIVEDSYKDKSNALGINVPVGTWFVGMKVNNIETWERIKGGELKGFSVESMITLEDFAKQDNNMNIETNDMFWSRLRNILRETFGKKEDEELASQAAISGLTEDELETELEAIREEVFGEETPEPVETPQEPAREEKPVETPPVEEVKPDAQLIEEPDGHLEQLINSLRQEVEALKEMNSGLQDKIRDMGSQPSVSPVNTNARPGASSTYQAWREQISRYI